MRSSRLSLTALLLSSSALAQPVIPDQLQRQVPGSVQECIESHGLAVPCPLQDLVPVPGVTAPFVRPAPDQRAGIFAPSPVTPLVQGATPPANLTGSYCMALDSGVIAAGLTAGSPIFSFRYGGNNFAAVRKVTISAGDSATAFTAGVVTFDLFAARSFTASDSGGTAATITGNNGKLRTQSATTGVSDVRISSTGLLTAGTRTLDSTALASVSTSVPATAGTQVIAPTALLAAAIGENPLVLAKNEGFVIQATVPATGAWSASVSVCWDEALGF